MTSRGRSSHRHRDTADVNVPAANYADYPVRRPFVNVTDDTQPPVGRAVNTAPESSRDAIMSALMNLQQKIHHLERDRRSAEDSVRSLTAETSRYGDMVRTLPSSSSSHGVGTGEERRTGADHRPRGLHTTEPSIPASSPLSHSRQQPPVDADVSRTSNGFDRSFGGVDDVHGKLERAHDRCRQLEHELANMQQLLRDAERVTSIGASVSAPPPLSSGITMATSPPTKQSAPYVNGGGSSGANQDKIDRLEREHLKLTASQTVAESKLRELEVQVLEEKLLRKIQQQRQREDEEEGEVPIDFIEEDRPVKLKKKKKKKSPVPKASNNYASLATTRGQPKTSTASASAANKQRRDPANHYKLNLADIPFISGKSTAQSHSLPANFQEVLSLMKNHNARLCHNPHQHLQQELRQLHKTQSATATSARPRSKSRERSSPDDLSDLLQQLQDEFGQLSLEHDELLDQLRDTSDDRLRDALEGDLDRIVSRMEAKGHQIMRLKNHRDELHGQRGVLLTSGERPHSAGARLVPDDGMVEVTTTVKTKGKGAGAIVVPQTNRALASLSLYKDIKKIQTTLRKDDITWDC